MIRMFKNEPSGVQVAELETSGSSVTVRQGPWGGTLDSTVAEGTLDEVVAAREQDQWVRERLPEPHAVRFYREGFEQLLVDKYGVKRQTPSDHVIEAIETTYGRTLQNELRELLRLRGSVHLGWCNFGEWRIWPDDLIPVDLDADNTFEALITSYSPHCLRVIMADLVPLGTAGNGDCYYASLEAAVPTYTPVFLWDHETGELNDFADAISTLAELNRLYEINSGDEDDGDAKGDPLAVIKEGMARIQKRVAPSWHYSSLVENSGAECEFEAGTAAFVLFFRSGWITALLKGEVQDAASMFEPLTKHHNGPNMQWARAATFESTKLPSRALYWLFFNYFLDRPELAETIELAKASKSRFVRDAARTFEQLSNGRGLVGKMDWAEMRKRFLALDLDPSRAAEKAAKAEAEAAARKAANEVARSDARAFAAGKSTADIAKEIWRSLDDRVRALELARAMVEQDPSLAVAGRRQRKFLMRTDGADIALRALGASRSPGERALLGTCALRIGPHGLGDVVALLTVDERSKLRSTTRLMDTWRTWTRAKYGREGVIAALSELRLLGSNDLAKLYDHLWWSDDAEDDDDDDDEDDDTGAVAGSTFGPLGQGWPSAEDVADKDEESSAESDDDDSDDDEDDDDEDDDDDDDDEEEDDGESEPGVIRADAAAGGSHDEGDAAGDDVDDDGDDADDADDEDADGDDALAAGGASDVGDVTAVAKRAATGADGDEEDSAPAAGGDDDEEDSALAAGGDDDEEDNALAALGGDDDDAKSSGPDGDDDEDADEGDSDDDSDDDDAAAASSADDDEDSDDEEGDDEDSDEDNEDDEEQEDLGIAADSDDGSDALENLEIEDERPLAETPAYLKSMTSSEGLAATLRAYALVGGGEDRLRSIMEKGPSELVPSAIALLARYKTASSREALERLLDGPHRRSALYALAMRADGAALAAVEAACAKLDGFPHITVYERLMREAVRGAAGKEVDVNVLRLALQTVMENAKDARDLHVTALRLVAKYMPRDEGLAWARSFVDAEQQDVSAAAVNALSAMGASPRVTVYDSANVAALFDAEGVDGLRRALRDPDGVGKDVVLVFAKSKKVIDQLVPDAIAVVQHLARFPYYTNNYQSDGYDRMQAAIKTLFDVQAPEVTQVLHRLRCSSNPIVRRAFEYNDKLGERLEAYGPIVEVDELDVLAGGPLTTAPATVLGAPKFVLGKPVHGIGFVRDMVIVACGGRVAAFTRDGELLPISENLVDGWGYDVDYHAGANALVISYSHGHCIVYDGATLKKRKDLTHGGGVRKAKFSPDGKWLATCTDWKDLRVFDVATLECVLEHKEPYDVNTVAWLDDSTIAFGTDQHVGVIPRTGGEPTRVSTGGVAEVQIVDGKIVAGSAKHGIVWIDPTAMEIGEKLPIDNVARLRVSRDRKKVFVAAWGGTNVGFSVWDRATGERDGDVVFSEELFGMEIDPQDGSIFVGGKANKVTVLAPDGTLPAEAPQMRGDQRGQNWIVPTPGSDEIAWIARTEQPHLVDVLNSGGGLTRYDLTRSLALPLGRPERALPRNAECFAWSGERPVLAAFDALIAAGATVWWRKTDRCERVLSFGDTLVAMSGKHIGWFAADTGELLHEVNAAVASSWVHYAYKVDDDLFVVMGYDDNRLQLWSNRKRARVGEVQLNHRGENGRFERPYGVGYHAPSKRLLVSYWNYIIDVFAISPAGYTLERQLAMHIPMEFVALSDDAQTLVIGTEHELIGVDYADCTPRWRYQTEHEMKALCMLADGRVVAGCDDGALLVVG